MFIHVPIPSSHHPILRTGRPRIAAFEQLSDPSLRHAHDQRLTPKPSAPAPAPNTAAPRAARRPQEEARRTKTGRKKTNKDVEKTGVLAKLEDVGVSINGGTPKWMVYMGKSQ